MKREIDFTQGSPRKLILAFYWPLLMTSMLQQFYNFADTWIVGKGLGDNALAAVGNMGSLFFLIVGFSFGLANGFGVLVAQSYGAKDMKRLRNRLAGVIELGIILAVVLSVSSVIFLPHALLLLQTDELIIGDSLKYGYIVFGGLSAGICYNISASILRSLGDSRTPLKAIIISSILNLGLDSFFIFVLHTGVEGAAIATLCSQVVSSFICIGRLRKIDFIKLSREDFGNERMIFAELLGNGLPMAFMNSITAVGCMVVQYFVNGYGVVYTAAYAACSKYLNLFMNPATTAGNAMSAYTSQNYGAHKFERIRDGLYVCLGISTITYLIFGSLMVIKPQFLAGILLSGQDQIALVCQFLPRCGIMMICVDSLFVIRSAVQGMGKPMLPMVSGILEMILRISVISFFIGRIGFAATAYAEISAWIGALLINAFALYIELRPKLMHNNVYFSKIKSV
ncbi:MAG: MATE family efflux transporter [Butyrivibrio sp.]|uniref:MATE family efflux transporter n=1 Tax=Butyrivibrio sp. TaxID=28121 RepID=UPI0025BDE2B5|nr:MATE family efflux transporter [Butyrivibrio sp.]MBQ6589800.1 MATE family efflux transporter [Butyrivibrio sp.]